MGFQVERLCYTLQEVAERWGLQVDDLLHMAARKQLKLAFWTEPRFLTVYTEEEPGEFNPCFSFSCGTALLNALHYTAKEVLAHGETTAFSATSVSPETKEMLRGLEDATLRLETSKRDPSGACDYDTFTDKKPLPVLSRQSLFITTEELRRMEAKYPELVSGKDGLHEPEARNSKPVSSRAERTDLLLIGGLLGLLKEKWKDATGTEPSDAQVMDALDEWLPGTFKTRTTQDRFARARRALDNTE